MRIPAVAAVAALSLMTGSCADAPTRPERDVISPDQAPSLNRGSKAGPLNDLRISEALPNGRTFVGNVTIKRFDWDLVENRLEATVEVSGKVMKEQGGIMKTADGRPAIIPPGKAITITGVPVTLSRDAAFASAGGLIHPAQATACDILFLDLGPIHLDLLGLVLDISPIQIDLDAEPGAGNLLGNLLCALLGLFNPLGALAQILALLDAINALLGALGGAGGFAA